MITTETEVKLKRRFNLIGFYQIYTNLLKNHNILPHKSICFTLKFKSLNSLSE